MGQLNRPGRPRLNPFRVIGQLGIDKLNQAVPPAGRGNLRRGILYPLFFRRNLPGNNRPLFRPGGRGQAQDGGAILGAIADHRLPFSVGENQLIEAYDRDVEWSEISPQARMDPAASIGIKLYDGAANRGACRNGDPIIDVNRIKQATFQRLPSLHRNVLEQLNRQRSIGRDPDRGRLAQRGTAKQAEQKARRHKPLPGDGFGSSSRSYHDKMDPQVALTTTANVVFLSYPCKIGFFTFQDRKPILILNG